MPLTSRRTGMPSGTVGARGSVAVTLAAATVLAISGCASGGSTAAGSGSSATELPQPGPDTPPTSGVPSDWPTLPGARTVTGESSTVTGTVDEATLTAYAKMADTAVQQVSHRWTRPWTRRLLVVAPADPAGFREQLGRTDDLSQVAAITDGPVDPDGRSTRNRIVLNPQAFGRLTPEGRQVVITHEATHVAMRSSLAGAPPLWLAEGYADHVGYSASKRPTTELATPLLERVRKRVGPKQLPTTTDFTAGSGNFLATYLSAWLAVDLIARTHGEAKLRRFVQAATVKGDPATAEAAADRAFVDVLGTTRADFTRQWLQRLEHLAHD